MTNRKFGILIVQRMIRMFLILFVLTRNLCLLLPYALVLWAIDKVKGEENVKG